MPALSDLPTGTVTFLFTDIEGSTRIVQELGDAYPPLLEQHHDSVRSAIETNDGLVVSTEGDSFFAVFPAAPAALRSRRSSRSSGIRGPTTHGSARGWGSALTRRRPVSARGIAWYGASCVGQCRLRKEVESELRLQAV